MRYAVTALDIRVGDRLRCYGTAALSEQYSLWPATVFVVRKLKNNRVYVEGFSSRSIEIRNIHTDPTRTDGWYLLPRK